MGKIGEDKKLPGNAGAPAPVVNDARAKTDDGARCRIVVAGCPDTILSFDSEHLRDTACKLIQNSVKRGAQNNAMKVTAREGVYFFCSCAFVEIPKGW